MGRGLERRTIFNDAEDRENFLSRLGDNLEFCQAKCLAWALMSNHYHVLIQVDQKPLSKFMAPLLGGYASYYNRRHSRSGYVFQNRYQSILCDAENYLVELVRYIHLNPLRAGMVANLQELEYYPWTGHAGIYGRHYQPWHHVSQMLQFFSSSLTEARRQYKAFLNDSLTDASPQNLSGGGLIRSAGGWESISQLRQEHRIRVGDERILGNTDFVLQTLEEDDLEIDPRSELERAGWNLNTLISETARYFCIEERQVLSKTRHRKISVAKSLICYWGTDALGLTGAEIAAKLNISQPAVSYRVAAGRKYCEIEQVELSHLRR